MYICMCFAINEDQIKQAISEGYDTINKLSEHLNVAAGCGTCYHSVMKLLEDFSCRQKKNF